MTAEQSMMQAITQAAIKAAAAEIMAVKEAVNLGNAAGSPQVIPTTCSPVLKQPTFNEKVGGKYQEL